MRQRLTLLSGVAIGLTAIIVAVIAYWAVRSQLLGEVDKSLRNAEGLTRRIVAQEGLRRPPPRRGRPTPGLGGPVLFGAIVDARGKPVLTLGATRSVPTERAYGAVARRQRPAYFTDIERNGRHLRLRVAALPDRRAFVVAREVDDVDAVLSRLRWLLGIVVLVGTAVAIASGRAIAGASLRPLQRLEDAAGHVASTGDLTKRIEVKTDDEVGSLARQFNSMLSALERAAAALEESVSAQQQLIADASHELRTPITTLRTNVEVLGSIERLDPQERALLLSEVEAELRDFSLLIEDIIEVARGDDRARAVEREPVSASEVLRDAVAWAERHWPAVHYRTSIQELVVEGDAGRLSRAFRNLLDNAGKWSPPGADVEVELTASELRIRDHGPGVSDQDQAHVFDRFYRSDRSQLLAGSGLGLAIVRQVAGEHGATCDVRNAADGGAEFSMRFSPAAVERALA